MFELPKVLVLTQTGTWPAVPLPLTWAAAVVMSSNVTKIAFPMCSFIEISSKMKFLRLADSRSRSLSLMDGGALDEVSRVCRGHIDHVEAGAFWCRLNVQVPPTAAAACQIGRTTAVGVEGLDGERVDSG